VGKGGRVKCGKRGKVKGGKRGMFKEVGKGLKGKGRVRKEGRGKHG
jgi:hypothetical protein